MRRLLCVILLLAGTATAAPRLVYRWVDSAGSVHFSDIPVPGATAIQVDDGLLTTSETGDPVAAGGELSDDPDYAKFQIQQCKQKKQQLSRYEASLTIIERDLLGVDHEYSEKERDKLIALTQGEVKRLCGAES